MYVFVVGMERCGTHSSANIIKSAAKPPAYVVHEDEPTWCGEAKLLYDGFDIRTPMLKKKISILRDKHKSNNLVVEANHRLSFFIPFLMREFAPNCKFVFLVRDPIETIVSRIATWAHYKDFKDLYPESFFDKMKQMVMGSKEQFNDFRLSPPGEYVHRPLGELYAWEWLETYKFAREGLHNIPAANRKLMRCEDLTSNFQSLLDFIGQDYFTVTDEVRGWAKTRSDTVYRQERHVKSDVVLSQDRNPCRDETLTFARKTIDASYDLIKNKIASELAGLPKIDRHLVEMDFWIDNWLNLGVNKYKTRTFL